MIVIVVEREEVTREDDSNVWWGKSHTSCQWTFQNSINDNSHYLTAPRNVHYTLSPAHGERTSV